MHRYSLLLTVLAVLASPRAAVAQSGVPVSYQIQIIPAGAANPLTAAPIPGGTLTIAYSPAICNQPEFPTSPPAITANPTTFVWSDPVNANRLCISSQPAFLNGLPRAGSATVAGYVYTMTATNADGTSARGGPSNPFSLMAPLNPPAVPTGVQARQ